MSVYLEKHPPARRQYRDPRRADPTGAIVIHTAENSPDLRLPDDGAEAVARFISTRTDAAGSYHSIVDSDSIVHVGHYEWEMFGEGTGGNRWALHLSFACQAAQWPRLPKQWVDGAIANAALEATTMARWVGARTGITIPARVISKREYRAGAPGFISHGALDPGRRSDPGAHFPWDDFLARFARHNDQEPIMDPYCLPNSRRDTVADIQRVFADAGFYQGRIDQDPYLMTASAAHAMKNALAEMTADLEAAQQALAEAEAQLAAGPASNAKADLWDAFATMVRAALD